MYKNIDDLVKSFNTNPILFMGSGITRRYYNLPSWAELLKVFIEKMTDDEFAFSAYKNKAKQEIKNDNELYPRMADFIERDFNEKWYQKIIKRRVLDEEFLEKIKDGCSPFKVEVAQYIKDSSVINEEYESEIGKLREISEKNISSIITTNYDNFFEETIKEFKTYVGQDELIFSNIQGIGEIYKIHGSIERPESIIINSEDYGKFEEKSQYLAAKLLTLFLEYPIIFMGYSLSDSNIQNILSDIVKCLPIDKIGELKQRLIFVEYTPEDKEYEITTHTIKIGDKLLEMTKIRIKDFSILYKALGKRKRKLSVKLLRDFKEQLCEFVMTNESTQKIKVANLEDNRLNDEELAIAIGKSSDISIKGIKGITANEWYRSIVLNDFKHKADELLEGAEVLLKQNSGKIPLNKYLARCNDRQRFKNLADIAIANDFEVIISNSIKKNRRCINQYNSMEELWNHEKQNLEKATRLLAYFEKDKITIEELETILKQIFENNPNILDDKKIGTNIKRLIRIYDWLKFSDKVKELFN